MERTLEPTRVSTSLWWVPACLSGLQTDCNTPPWNGLSVSLAIWLFGGADDQRTEGPRLGNLTWLMFLGLMSDLKPACGLLLDCQGLVDPEASSTASSLPTVPATPRARSSRFKRRKDPQQPNYSPVALDFEEKAGDLYARRDNPFMIFNGPAKAAAVTHLQR